MKMSVYNMRIWDLDDSKVSGFCSDKGFCDELTGLCKCGECAPVRQSVCGLWASAHFPTLALARVHQ